MKYRLRRFSLRRAHFSCVRRVLNTVHAACPGVSLGGAFGSWE